jgi:serine phosphatase RsbU (regulator of sigma subunit)
MNPSQAKGHEPPDSVFKSEIAWRAYDKWVERGRPSGTQVQDWLEAEAEGRQRREMACQLTVFEKRLLAEHAVCRILAVSDRLGDAAPKIIQAICESLDWDFGEIWVLDRNANVLRCVEVWHSPKVEVLAFVQDTRQHTFSRGVGLPGRIWASQSLAWIPDLIADGRLARAPLAAEAELRGAVGFPIHIGREFFGVIDFFSREVRQPDEEVAEMMTSIGSQIGQFIERRQAQEELLRQDEEHCIARRIQQGLLPKAMPSLAGFRVSGRLATANSVGGDCFDFIPCLANGKENLLVVVADASGHGIAAALIMAETRAYLRALALTSVDIGTLLAVTNNRLANDLAEGFVTLLVVQIDPDSRSLLYTNAGHCSGYVLDRQGQTKAILPSTGPPLGIVVAGRYPIGPVVHLESGDLIFLFTDGIIEATSPEGELFGWERTLDILRRHQQEMPAEILSALFDAVGNFCDHQHQDDLTAVAIEVEAVG